MKMAKALSVMMLIALMLVAIGVRADVPQMINYQGRLTDSGGDPLDTTVSMTFAIYDDSTGGSILWTETQPGIVVTNGLFDVKLGIAVPVDVSVFAAGTRWLGITVGTDPELDPRTQLISVPYAYRVSTVDGATGGTISGDVSIQSGLDVNGTVHVLGFEMPTGASSGYVLTSDGNGIGTWQMAPSSSMWTVIDSVLYTNQFWGLARGNCSNVLAADSHYTHTNWGVACTTGVVYDDRIYCTVGGGLGNSAEEDFTTVCGGTENEALKSYGFVGGGMRNHCVGLYSTIVGGQRNFIGYNTSFIGGGDTNFIDAHAAVICGGQGNEIPTVDGSYSAIAGGEGNMLEGLRCFIGGGLGNEIALDADYSVISGGVSGRVAAWNGTVGGGSYNFVYGRNGGVFSGFSNQAGSVTDDTAVFVGGGTENSALSKYSTIAGGKFNTAYAPHSFVGGGQGNYAGGDSGYTVIAGGRENQVEGDYSALCGGREDTVTTEGDYSMVYGYGVYIDNSYRAAFFDGSHSGRLGLNRDDRDGGVNHPIHVGTDATNGYGAHLTAGGVWTNGSSREFKENFRPLDGRQLLDKVSAMQLESWTYRNSKERHIGPVAEEFVAAFDVGSVRESDGRRDDHYLAATDVAGVALIGVKELYQITQELERKTNEIEELRLEMAQLQAAVEMLLAQRNVTNTKTLANDQ